MLAPALKCVHQKRRVNRGALKFGTQDGRRSRERGRSPRMNGLAAIVALTTILRKVPVFPAPLSTTAPKKSRAIGIRSVDICVLLQERSALLLHDHVLLPEKGLLPQLSRSFVTLTRPYSTVWDRGERACPAFSQWPLRTRRVHTPVPLLSMVFVQRTASHIRAWRAAVGPGAS